MSKHTIILDRKTGKPKSRPPRMAPVLARGQKHKADRHEAKLRDNAAKARGKG